MTIKGESRIDDRGKVSFVNDFRFNGVKRFYLVENHKAGFIRAWHAHKEETKYVFVTKGAIKFGMVYIRNWLNPQEHTRPSVHILSAEKPEIVKVHGGWANGFMTLTDDAQVMFFSDKTVGESLRDDYRFPARTWDIWKVEER